MDHNHNDDTNTTTTTTITTTTTPISKEVPELTGDLPLLYIYNGHLFTFVII